MGEILNHATCFNIIKNPNYFESVINLVLGGVNMKHFEHYIYINFMLIFPRLRVIIFIGIFFLGSVFYVCFFGGGGEGGLQMV